MGTGPIDMDELRELFGQLATISKLTPLEAT